MTKSLSIKETGVAKSLSNIRYVDTEKYGGGSQTWVDVADRKLKSKTVRKSGTYKASKDDCYGYSKVTVKIKGLKDAMQKGVTGEIYDPTQSGGKMPVYWKHKSITIKEGDLGKTMPSIDYLEIPKQGGGMTKWAAEENFPLKEKTVKGNGTFYAELDDCYGFSEFTVEVDKESHTGDDGNEYVDDVVDGGGDEGGDEVVEKLVPSSIKIETKPTKLTYEDGQDITIEGIVVKAYCGDGNLFTSEDYPDGIIPIDELEFEPKKADFEKAQFHWVLLTSKAPYSIKSAPYPGYTDPSAGMIKTTNAAGGGGHVNYKLDNFGATVGKTVRISGQIKLSERVDSWSTASIQTLNENSHIGNFSKVFYEGTYNVNGKFVVGEYDEFLRVSHNAWRCETDYSGIKIAIGDSGNQAVTVSWGRPEDGKELSDKYDIQVGD